MAPRPSTPAATSLVPPELGAESPRAGRGQVTRGEAEVLRCGFLSQVPGGQEGRLRRPPSSLAGHESAAPPQLCSCSQRPQHVKTPVSLSLVPLLSVQSSRTFFGRSLEAMLSSSLWARLSRPRPRGDGHRNAARLAGAPVTGRPGRRLTAARRVCRENRRRVRDGAGDPGPTQSRPPDGGPGWGREPAVCRGAGPREPGLEDSSQAPRRRWPNVRLPGLSTALSPSYRTCPPCLAEACPCWAAFLDTVPQHTQPTRRKRVPSKVRSSNPTPPGCPWRGPRGRGPEPVARGPWSAESDPSLSGVSTELHGRRDSADGAVLDACDTAPGPTILSSGLRATPANKVAVVPT
ncbi:uncharacterized protein LOC132001581 [Mustela nigripes]|uniref:uncharacterized protein LOC132001581 n=1 Tax=Mustela nigripes TaxID=77151 RepID=UPI0028156C7D|nr:uncharacterized protein LOC132001581 [Mustela nigripes]